MPGWPAICRTCQGIVSGATGLYLQGDQGVLSRRHRGRGMPATTTDACTCHRGNSTCHSGDTTDSRSIRTEAWTAKWSWWTQSGSTLSWWTTFTYHRGDSTNSRSIFSTVAWKAKWTQGKERLSVCVERKARTQWLLEGHLDTHVNTHGCVSGNMC